MPTTMGSIFARDPKQKQRGYGKLISIGEVLEVELLYHDVPCIVMHRRGNGPWQYVVINRDFDAAKIPRNSDVQLSAIVAGSEKVVYRLAY